MISISERAQVEYVAVNEGKIGFCADVGLESIDARVVEADDEVMAIDEVAVTGVYENATVADDGAGGVGMGGVCLGYQWLVEWEEVRDDAWVVAFGEEPLAEETAEVRERTEGLVGGAERAWLVFADW